MRLHSLRLEGFRRFYDATIEFSDATFLIGQNNHGKSSILKALEYLLSGEKRISLEEFYQIHRDGGENYLPLETATLTAEFRNVPEEAVTWQGFKNRVLRYAVSEDELETGLRVVYRKTFSPGKDVLVEMRQHARRRKPEFEGCATIEALRMAGLSEEAIARRFPNEDPARKLTAAKLKALEEIDEVWEVDETTEEWFQNPGGIQGNVLDKLPVFLLIPAQDKTEELTKEKGGALHWTLNELFALVRNESENYRNACGYLEKLAQELDPTDENREFGKMMGDLNGMLSGVFPGTRFIAAASLSDADEVLKPKFDVRMHSNITTPVHLQGTGMVRSAVFALLRYKQEFEEKRNKAGGAYRRPVLIGFEEPEIYLHPNASNQMRERLYELAQSPTNQIVCSTHSPYMIDLGKRTGQVLNRLYLEIHKYDLRDGGSVSDQAIKSIAFNTSAAFHELQNDERDYVKMLIKMDDYVAKVFFSNFVLVVEGDTEEVVLKETIARMPPDVRDYVNAHWQIIKARGKAVMIPFIKYLRAVGIRPWVIHDEDGMTAGAKKFNAPIAAALDEPARLLRLTDCIEDVIGCAKVTTDKPYNAYKYAAVWPADWEQVPGNWKKIMETVFQPAFAACAEEEARRAIGPAASEVASRTRGVTPTGN